MFLEINFTFVFRKWENQNAPIELVTQKWKNKSLTIDLATWSEIIYFINFELVPRSVASYFSTS